LTWAFKTAFQEKLYYIFIYLLWRSHLTSFMLSGNF